MRRTKLFGLMMALVVGMGFTSCSDDEDAFINITVEGNVPETLTVGESLTINYSVVSSDRLDIIEHLINNVVVKSVEDFTSNTSHTGSFTITAEEVGTIYATIRVTDRKGKVEPRDFSIEVESNIESFTAVLMGNYTDAELGSFFSTVNGEVYMITPAGENAEMIDFVYFYGSNNSATITAPDNDDVIGTGDSKLYAPVAEWATRNATRFNQLFSGITVEEFDAMNNDALIVANTASDVDLKMANFLNKDALVAFITVEGKKGIFKVADLDTEAKTITIDVKVQK